MRRLALPLLCAALSAAGPAAAAGRGIWMWEEDSYRLLESGKAAKEAISFLKSKGIDTVYLYADSYKWRSLIAEKPRLYRRLLRRFDESGLRACALLGSWHLHTEEYVLPGRKAEAMAMYGRVLRYNDGAEPEESFACVNLDIEPHMLKGWKEDREGLLRDFLDLGRELMAMKKNAGLELPTGPAIPFWLDGIELEWRGARKPASEHVLDVYDYAALMDYRNRAEGSDGMIEHALDELKYASSLGRELRVGVEVSPNELEKVTFDRLTEAQMDRELSLAREAFAGERSFGGFVIHNYGSYRDWLKRRPGGAGKE